MKPHKGGYYYKKVKDILKENFSLQKFTFKNIIPTSSFL